MLTLRWIWRQFRDFLTRNQANAVEAYSAQAALFVIISFFPSAILLLSLLPHLPFTEAQITNIFVQIVPDAIGDYAQGILNELYQASTSVPLLSLTALLALWSASKGSIALMRGLDRIYGVHRTRGYIFLRLLASAYVLVFFVLLMAVLAFLGFGGVVFDWLTQFLPVLKTSVFLKRGLQFLVSFAVLFLLFWFLYVAVPRRRKILPEIPGALISAGGWVGFSSLYSLYLDNIGGTSFYYGSLSLVMFSLLWLYFCMYIFFVGAEINVWLQDNRPFSRPIKKNNIK